MNDSGKNENTDAAGVSNDSRSATGKPTDNAKGAQKPASREKTAQKESAAKSTQDTADALISEMSEPRDDLPPEPENQFPGLKDRHGRPFDPDLHMTDETGRPLLTNKGQLRLASGPGRKKTGSTAESPKSTIGTPGGYGRAMATPESDPEADFQATGNATAQLVFLVGMTIGGDEWEPTETEKSYMATSWAQYYRAKGIQDLPPGVVVAGALVAYVTPRLSRPKTKSKIQRFGIWLKNKLKKGRANAAQPDSRNDRKRENHAGNAS